MGITGGSASGKTFVLDTLIRAFEPDEITLISLDNYYKDLEHQQRDENGQVNFDHPDAVDLQLFETHLHQLRQGNTVQIREYTYNNPNAGPVNMITYRPAPLLIVEGLFVFYKPEIKSLIDLRVFVDAQEHIKMARRIRRDSTDRGFQLEEILTQYETHVIPMYRKYVEPSRYDADIILMNDSDISRGAMVIINHLKIILRQLQPQVSTL
jgi:uridine kinase